MRRAIFSDSPVSKRVRSTRCGQAWYPRGGRVEVAISADIRTGKILRLVMPLVAGTVALLASSEARAALLPPSFDPAPPHLLSDVVGLTTAADAFSPAPSNEMRPESMSATAAGIPRSRAQRLLNLLDHCLLHGFENWQPGARSTSTTSSGQGSSGGQQPCVAGTILIPKPQLITLLVAANEFLNPPPPPSSLFRPPRAA